MLQTDISHSIPPGEQLEPLCIMQAIDKGQVEGVSKKDVLVQKKFVESLFGI